MYSIVGRGGGGESVCKVLGKGRREVRLMGWEGGGGGMDRNINFWTKNALNVASLILKPYAMGPFCCEYRG